MSYLRTRVWFVHRTEGHSFSVLIWTSFQSLYGLFKLSRRLPVVMALVGVSCSMLIQ